MLKSDSDNDDSTSDDSTSNSDTSSSDDSNDSSSESSSSDEEVKVKLKKKSKINKNVIVINNNLLLEDTLKSSQESTKDKIKKDMMTSLIKISEKLNLEYFTIAGLKKVSKIHNINVKKHYLRKDYEFKIKLHYGKNADNIKKDNLILRDIYNKKKMNWNYLTLVGLKAICSMYEINIKKCNGCDDIKNILKKKHKKKINIK